MTTSSRFLCFSLIALTVAAIWPRGNAIADESNADIEQLRSAALETISTESSAKPGSNPAETQCGSSEGFGKTACRNFFMMQLSLIAIVLILHTYTGIHIIKRGIIFCDLVLDQLAAFGIVCGTALGIRYGTPASYAMAMGATLVGALLLAVIHPRNKLIPHEAIIGIMYAMALVACLLMADKLPAGGTEFKNTLVGSMSWASWPLVATTGGIYILLLAAHYILRHRIIGITENGSEVAHRVAWDFIFFLSQSIITILIVPVAGVLLAYGFLMIPAAIGLIFSDRWRAALIVGWTTGMAACSIGLFFSYHTDSPYGPSLLLAMGGFFIAALAIRCVSPRREEGAS